MNLIPEAVEIPNEPARLVLYGRPGLQQFCQLPSAKIRGMWAGGGRLFVVAGISEIEVKQDGTYTVYPGSIAESAGTVDPDPVSIASNGTQLMFVGGGLVYVDNGTPPGAVAAQWAVTGNGDTSASGLVWTSGPQFQTSWTGMPIIIDDTNYVVGLVNSATHLQVSSSSPVLPTATDVVWEIAAGGQVDGVTGGFQDGYFIINRVPTPGAAGDPGKQFNLSALYDGTRWNPLDYGVKEGAPDYISSILCDHEELWLFGKDYATEIWQNVGSQLVNGVATFPYQRIAGAYIQIASAAVWAPCSVAQTVCFLALEQGQTVAIQATGLQPQRISTHAQEQVWNQPGYRVNDAYSYSYVEDGHIFWVLNFWQQGETWVYDVTEGLWHSRAAWNASTSAFQRYRPWFHAFIPEWSPGNTGVATGMHVVGDPATGILYAQSLNFYSDAGSPIQYQRAMAHLINENQYGYHHRLEVLMEMGAQNASDPLPLIGLDWSDDHGHTFNDAISRTINGSASGDYTMRAAFRRLGKSRDRVYRVGVNAQTKVALIDTYLEMTPGLA